MRRLALLLPLLLLTACDSQDDDLRVRLDPGTTATYRAEFTEVRPGEPDAVIATGTLTQRVVADGQTVKGQRGLTEVLVTGTGDYGGAVRLWYRAGDRQLEEVAYSVSLFGATTPLKAAAADPTLPIGVQRRIAAVLGKTAGGDSVIVRTPPRIVLEYPLEAAQSWTHFVADDIPLRSTRTVLGQETVETPDGDHACWQVRTVLFFGADELTDIDWVDCLDADGLVARTIQYRDIPVTGPTGEPTGGTVTQIERTVRTGAAR